MISKRSFLYWWIGGLIAFAITLYLHTPLVVEGVPGGILDHQAAPDAATVDAIQGAWREYGVMDQARIAMISDLIFIGIYGIGCVLGGLYFRRLSSVFVRALGWVALAGGVAFLITDYGETVSQLIQLTQGAGDDTLAGIASGLRPIKIASFIAAFVAILAGLIAARLTPSIRS
ncbi:hypothetical protein [Altererythrobacter lutimaris]|uniref:DUF2269 family protein n=1 Tax=Altererythrobacter lutimaris TaxID=2743979 RepID=A0A850H7I2_9SPHN|nr:hypothetical protein [Altererythrobacter lutimaris]NVE93823.1 hypothetical protein [Altererythrobacter lutimaris]